MHDLSWNIVILTNKPRYCVYISKMRETAPCLRTNFDML